jgi:PRTRC genetic system ThiF family protein
MLDLTYSLARPVAVRQEEQVLLVLVGCGGNGSHLAPHLARIAREVQRRGRRVQVTFIDHDRVEAGNIGRANFCEAEVGLYKATTLAARYSAAYGLDIRAVARPFTAELFRFPPYQALTLLIGCVDRASARQELAALLDHNDRHTTRVWWLDLNNDATSGRVLLGCTADLDLLRHAFAVPSVCSHLPAPQLVYPDHLTPRPEELDGHGMSCQELQAANAQSLCINSLIAAYGAQYLCELLLTGGLRRFTTTISALSGVATSRYTTPASIATAIGQPDLFAHQTTSGVRAARAGSGARHA